MQPGRTGGIWDLQLLVYLNVLCHCLNCVFQHHKMILLEFLATSQLYSSLTCTALRGFLLAYTSLLRLLHFGSTKNLLQVWQGTRFCTVKIFFSRLLERVYTYPVMDIFDLLFSNMCSSWMNISHTFNYVFCVFVSLLLVFLLMFRKFWLLDLVV